MESEDVSSRTVSAGSERKLAAIMFTDIAGFSRQMGSDEARTLQLLDVHNHIISQAVAAHHGHVIKTIGDVFLVDFPSVVHAVQCAQQIQNQLEEARAEAIEIMRLMPRYSLEIARQRLPFKDPAVLEREINAWRKAGLK